MKRLVVVLLLAVISYTAIAQQGNPNPAQQHRVYIDSLLATVGIGRQNIPTGILYDRSITIASLQGFKQEKRVNRGVLMQAALELRNASYDTLLLPTTNIYGALPSITSTALTSLLHTHGVTSGSEPTRHPVSAWLKNC